ncbi:MAG: phenylacetate-CoA oxygenase subunit PaaJ [Bacteroidetes bacterium]|nr:phenylacetate-CoA oxygenase subunit PaaJ [Bacteroidota bacterium]
MSVIDTISTERLWSVLAEVYDPEVPVLSVVDLGIVRDLKLDGRKVEVIITPTYSGCPAMQAIEWDIRTRLLMEGFDRTDIKITTVLSPAWTTDWMSAEGREKLKAYGIAPPGPTASVCDTRMFAQDEAVQCPRCGSYNTTMVSRFGSTACKAFYTCGDCKEPFDHFKCH